MHPTRRAVIGAGIGAMACVGPWRTAFPQDLEPIRKTIPSTGETLNPVGIGTNRFGGDAAAREGLRATLARFHALGGRLIDTAEEYGSSERIIGDLSTDLGINGTLFLASKVRMFGHEAGLRSIEQSFERLRRETLDLMQVHDLIDYQTQIETLRALKADSRIRYIGITTAGDNDPAQTERLLRTEAFDFLQLSYSLDDRSAADRLLPLAADRGVAVVVNRPFGRGSIFGAIRDRSLPDWAAEFDCRSWAQFFLKYIISHPAVTCAIPGTRREEHAVDNLGAAFGRLPDAALRARQERFFDDLS